MPTLPPGAIHDSYWTSSPLVSGAVRRNLIRSPNKGLVMIRSSICRFASDISFVDYRTGELALQPTVRRRVAN